MNIFKKIRAWLDELEAKSIQREREERDRSILKDVNELKQRGIVK